MAGGRPILRVGLTGGIASGKTTVAGFMAEMGAFVVDADRIAHEVIAPGGSAYHEVVHRFGDDILAPDGIIDRAELGRRVFSDASERESLEAIVHPKVLAEVDRRLDRYRASGHSPIAVVDAALLVESGAYRRFDRLVVVRCSRDAQVQRLRARSGMNAAEALARIESQWSLEQKLAVADYIIDTDATLRETRHGTEQVYSRLLQDFERRHGPPGAREWDPGI
jgi:dephospho-CoA kinase